LRAPAVSSPPSQQLGEGGDDQGGGAIGGNH
jgi:hypothetical protein